MRRMLSTNVIAKAIPAATPEAMRVRALMPTDSEMRDAIARCTRDLDDMKQARGYSDWTVEKFDFKPVVSDDMVIVMGAMIIRRDD